MPCAEAVGNPPNGGASLNTHPCTLCTSPTLMLAGAAPAASLRPAPAHHRPPALHTPPPRPAAAMLSPPPPLCTPAMGRGHMREGRGQLRRHAAWHRGGRGRRRRLAAATAPEAAATCSDALPGARKWRRMCVGRRGNAAGGWIGVLAALGSCNGTHPGNSGKSPGPGPLSAAVVRLLAALKTSVLST